MAEKFDPAIIEAEENLLIDFQFLLQEVVTQKGVSLSELAEKAGVSKSRISQVLSPEANPTAKTFARLFHALGEEVTVGVKKKSKVAMAEPQPAKGTEPHQPFQCTEVRDLNVKMDDAQFVALLKEAAAKDQSVSNDNKKQVVVMESEVMMTLEAA
jgi:transcriptional regulator with XRE-family HTH domain